MVQIIPANDQWADAFRQIGGGVAKGYTSRSDENAIQKAIMDLGPNPTMKQTIDAITGTKVYDPQSKNNTIERFVKSHGIDLKDKQFDELKRHNQAQENISTNKNGTAASREAEIANYLSQGFNKDEAEALTSPYVPNSVKQGISRRVEDELSRGMRQNSTPLQQETVKDIPVQAPVSDIQKPLNVEEQVPVQLENEEAPSIGQTIENTVKAEEKPKPEWPEVQAPSQTTFAEKEKWRDKNQTFNSKLLKETKDKTKSHTNALIRYNRLNQLNEGKKLPSGMGRLVIDPETGEPRAIASLLGLVNKETQDFVKTMNDFLVDAKTYFGSRVTNFDVQAFKSRLPTLLNTDDGRRLIINQMKLMEDLQILHDKTLEDGLKHYGRNASYSDIQKIVDEKTSVKEEQIINKINNLDKATNYMELMANNPKFKDTTLMHNSKTDKFRAFSPSELNEAKSKGWEKW
jgi:hypothetical protein